MEDGRSKLGDGERAGPWRLFIAIPLPDAVKEEIEKVQREMRGKLPGNFMRWTKREQFHVTLKFLGNVAEARVGELSETLREACRPVSTLRLRAERIGFFPDMRFPRVTWVWVHDEGEALTRLQASIEMSAKDFAEKIVEPVLTRRERSQEAFVGHVTIARSQGVKRPQAEILSWLARGMTERVFGEWVADKVELIRSDLSPAGSRYTTVETFPLLGNRD